MNDQPSLFDQRQNDEFKNKLNNGGKLSCPCCGRYAQIYKRKISHSMVLSMAKCYCIQRQEDNDFIQFKRFTPGAANGFHDLKYFGLIEAKMHDKDNEQNKRTSGYWRVTTRGINFLQGILSIEKYAYIFDDTLLRVSDKCVTVHECLETGFNYKELMEGI